MMAPTFDEQASTLTKSLLADARRIPMRLPGERAQPAPWKSIAVFAASVVVIGSAVAGVSMALHSASVAKSVPASPAGHWRSIALKGVVGGLSSVSCLDSAYCVAVDHDGNLWVSTNPGGGTAAWKFIAGTTAGTVVSPGKGGTTSVSCAGDPSRCEAVYQGTGFAIRTVNKSGESGGSWMLGLGDRGDAFINRNSCAGALCVMVGGVPSHVPGHPVSDQSGFVFSTTVFNGTWAGGGYGNSAELPGSSALTAVSCPSPSFCVAADTSGDVITSSHPGPTGSSPLSLTVDPSAWKVSHSVVPAVDSFAALSCPSVTFCVAITRHGDVVTSTNPTGGASAWKITTLDGSMMLDSVSCATRDFCVVGGDSESVFVSHNPADGSPAWTQVHVTAQGAQAIVALSCPSTGFCIGVDGGDGVHVYSNPSG
jgi:hypothetical protein